LELLLSSYIYGTFNHVLGTPDYEAWNGGVSSNNKLKTMNEEVVAACLEV
jgi:hypothetical protein